MKTFDEIMEERRAKRKVTRQAWGKDITRIRHKIPRFVSLLGTYSPSLAASYAGFNWSTWRQALLQEPDVRARYDQYIDENEWRKFGLMG